MLLIAEEVQDASFITEDVGAAKNYYLTGTFLQAEVTNRNGRRYSKDLLEREVNRYNQNYVSRNRALGELGHPCFSSSAEVLTKNGWKSIVDVTENDEVLVLDPNTRESEYSKVNYVTKNLYEGNMLQFENRLFKTTVTPYHKFVLYDIKNEPFRVTAQEISDYLNDSENKTLSHAKIPKTSKFKNKSPQHIDINGKILPFNEFCSFLALFLAEGYCQKVKNKKNSYVSMIYQNEGPKANKIQFLLDTLTEHTDIKWSRTIKPNRNRTKNTIIWKTHNNELNTFLFTLGKNFEKYIPQFIIDQLDATSAEKMMYWFCLVDGRVNSVRKNHMKFDISSTSKKLMENFSQIITLAGYTTKTQTQIVTKDYMFAGRMILSKNRRPLHFNKILKSENICMDKRFLKVKSIKWNDFVYCLNTKYNTFYVRDNGYTFWSGNCNPSINLDRVSHVITELYPNGNDFIGKAKILDTPYGKIVKNFMSEGITLGVSSRGVGSLKQANGYQQVQDDFMLATAADIVADPSAPSAYVTGIMENNSWWLSDKFGQKALECMEQQKKDFSKLRKIDEETKLNAFRRFLKAL